jgi:hypothetical protein
MWQADLSIVIKTYSKFHIDVWITGADGRLWHFTGFYGEPKRAQRKDSWWLLLFLRNENDLPRLFLGDFNETLHSHEQIGGNERHECRFSDLGYSGLPYTWDNRRQGLANIKVRLERALANSKWLDLFRDLVVLYILMTESNHSGLLIRTNSLGEVHRRGSRKHPFWYENMWRRHHTYYDSVSDAWNAGCMNLGDVLANLGNVQRRLSTW